MLIRICITVAIPEPRDRAQALEQAEAAIENAIDNDDLTLYMDPDTGNPVEVSSYTITAEEVED